MQRTNNMLKILVKNMEDMQNQNLVIIFIKSQTH